MLSMQNAPAAISWLVRAVAVLALIVRLLPVADDFEVTVFAVSCVRGLNERYFFV